MYTYMYFHLDLTPFTLTLELVAECDKQFPTLPHLIPFLPPSNKVGKTYKLFSFEVYALEIETRQDEEGR